MAEHDPATRRSLAAQVAANVRWSKESPYGPDSTPAKARRGLEEKFLREVDPGGVLPEEERQRRAACARKAFYARLALASANARRARSTKRPSTPDGTP
jgi:hypothetical protein